MERLVAFYITQHNTVLPHPAFSGQTPEEMYAGTGDCVPATLATAKANAKAARFAANRAATCATCERAAPAADSAVA